MASFEVLTEKQAPPRPSGAPSRKQADMCAYEGYVTSLKKGQAGKLATSPGETTRSVTVRVRKAAARLGRAVDVWSVGDEVYFRQA